MRKYIKTLMYSGNPININPCEINIPKSEGSDIESTVPIMPLASIDEAALQRAKLKEMLLNGKPVSVASGGKISLKEEGTEVAAKIPVKPLASIDEAALQRAKLKEMLLNGKPVSVASGGKISLKEEGTEVAAKIPVKPLAMDHWYQKLPDLFQAEQSAMAKIWPDFKLQQLDDGQLYWVGFLEPGIYESKFHEKRQYMVMALYNNNHPHKEMGSSVKIYLVHPTIDDLRKELNVTRLLHVLQDSSHNEYLCTMEEEGMQTGDTITTAASVLLSATRWLTAYELVVTGELPLIDFNTHGKI